MLSPVIMIGCGGSGTKAVRFVRDSVVRRLREVGWRGPLPEAWSFIGIDTNEKEEDTTMIPPFPPGDFIELSVGFDDYQVLYDRFMQQYPPTSEAYKQHLLGWLPDRNGPDVPLKEGAGQFRAVGRAAGLVGLQSGKVLPRLQDAFNNAKRGVGLDGVSQLLGGDRHGTPGRPIVVVCASMAGGTGAGVALDVVDLVRRIDGDGQNPALVLFTNDIFTSDQNAHMVGNSMAMLSELLATYWNKTSSGLGPGDIFAHSQANPGHGPATVWVVSATGMLQESIGDNNIAVYQAAGEALSGWATDLNIQTNIRSWLTGNMQANANLNNGGYPFGQVQPGVMSSFGAAVVTVGRTRFQRWAQDLLARSVMEKLVSGHDVHSNLLPASDAELVDEKRIDKIAANYWRVIYGDEFPELEELDPDSWKGLAGLEHRFLPASSEGLRSQISRQLEDYFAGSTKMGPGQWVTTLTSGYEYSLVEVTRDAQSIPRQEQDAWATETTAYMAEAASYVLARTSIDVAVRCLKDCNDYLKSRITTLSKSGTEAVENAEAALNSCRLQLQQTRGRLSLERKESSVVRAIDATVDLLVHQWYLEREKEISKLYQLAITELNASLMQILSQATSVIGKAFKPDEKDKSEVSSWPKSIDHIPIQYLPSSIELPLEDENEWKPLLEDLCKRSARPEIESELPIEQARILIVAGDDGQNIDRARSFIEVDRDKPSWRPGHDIAWFKCDADSESVSKRVATWMHTNEFDDAVTEGIDDYLTPGRGYQRSKGTVDYAARRSTFRRRFEDAIKIAQPLIEIDENLAGVIYQGTKAMEVDIDCSSLPFSTTAPALADATAVFGKYVDDNKKLSLQSIDTPSILITSFISKPVHPMIIRSLTDPIAKVVQEYRSHGQNGLQTQVWKWKRSRTLQHSIPVPPDSLAALIRGFAIARLCGYVTASQLEPVKISGAPMPGQQQQVVTFPWPLLSPVKERGEVLPALLEAFVLCFAEVGKDGLGAFEAYRRLFELGNRGTSTYLEDVEAMLQGQTLPYECVADPQVVGGSNITERRELATGQLQRSIEFYAKLEKRHFTGEEARSEVGYAINEDIGNVALNELLPAIRGHYEEVKADVGRLGIEAEEDPI